MQNQVWSTEQRLAKWVVYGVLAVPIVAILSRDLGLAPTLIPWLLYALFATPIIVLLSHSEIGVDSLVRWILYAVIAIPVVDVLAGKIEFGWWVLIVAGVAIYFLPAIIAFRRVHRNRIAILILNICLGWTFVGWVIALVWSFTADVEQR